MQGTDDGGCQAHRRHGAGARAYGRVGNFVVSQVVRLGQVLAFRRITVKTRLIADAGGVYHHID